MPSRPVPLQEGLGRPGQQHLVRLWLVARDPRDPVHVHPDVAVSGRRPLTGVDADPDPDVPSALPGVGGQAALHRDRGRDGVHRRAEDAEARVALRAHLDAGVPRQLAAHDRVVVEEETGVVGPRGRPAVRSTPRCPSCRR